MLFTKAIVTALPKEGDNWYTCRIPIFEDTTGTEINYQTLSCHAPGVYGGLNVGDCVYVAFEDAKLNIPVIIGRLYVNEQDDYSKGYFNNLLVTNTANLPFNTTIGGINISELVKNNLQVDIDLLYPLGTIMQTQDGLNPSNMYPDTTWEDYGTTTTSNGRVIHNWRRAG